jgi:hypothetical protein
MEGIGCCIDPCVADAPSCSACAIRRERAEGEGMARRVEGSGKGGGREREREDERGKEIEVCSGYDDRQVIKHITHTKVQTFTARIQGLGLQVEGFGLRV